MPDWAALVLSLGALLATLGAAVARPRWLPGAVAAVAGAVVLLASGAINLPEARHAVAGLWPTVLFLAALLLLADGCRREGVFDAIGAWIARASNGRPLRLLALTFIACAAVTAVLGLDATVVLLTPVVLVTATRLRTPAKAHTYACAHLANSASLLLVVSNLTNLLAFRASGLSFIHFAALMLLPWLGALGVEWVVLRRFFATELWSTRSEPVDGTGDAPPVPVFALGVLGLTLAGFVGSSMLGIAPVWFAAAGAAALALHSRTGPLAVLRSVEPGFLLFVLGLAVIVAAASDRGLGSAVAAVLPHGGSLPDLLGIAIVSGVLANLVNNLPATLILLPVAATLGTGPLLAMLVGVNVGPNLSYAGSLATLLWRRVLRAEGQEVALGEFTRLGLLTVPLGLVVCTFAVWVSVRGWG